MPSGDGPAGTQPGSLLGALCGLGKRASIGDGLQDILRTMRDETLLHAARERLDRERDARLAAQLAPFFGGYPEALLVKSSTDRSSFQADAEWLLQAFLGRRTASVVLRRIDAEMGVS